jgi:Rrf2 family protein
MEAYMKISTKGKYGLRAVVDIASHEGIVSIKDIHERCGISIRYLDKIMSSLKSADIVSSIRGSQGGYVLNKKPSNISVGDILRVLDEDFNHSICNKECEKESCTAKYIFSKINTGINEIIDNLYISEIIERNK